MMFEGVFLDDVKRIDFEDLSDSLAGLDFQAVDAEVNGVYTVVNGDTDINDVSFE